MLFAVKKSNGSASVQQNIGFYPDQGWKTMLTPAPVTGKFVDNAGHEFNASLSMSLTPEQLQSVINEILYQKILLNTILTKTIVQISLCTFLIL